MEPPRVPRGGRSRRPRAAGSRYATAKRSGHDIQLDKPEFVVDAMRGDALAAPMATGS